MSSIFLFLRDLYLSGFLNNKKSVIELGSKDVQDNIFELKLLLRQIKQNFCIEELFEYMDNSRLSNRYLWNKFGIAEYDCIDLDGAYNCYRFDLNNILQIEYKFSNKYDIVTNFGTTEHVFNQHVVFENIHNLCNANGIMIHALPISGYIGHSLFVYQVDFFYLLAKANGYDILGIWLAESDAYYLYSELKYRELRSSGKDVCISVVFSKNNDEPFVAPYQEAVYRQNFIFDFLGGKKSIATDFFRKYLIRHGVSNTKDDYSCAIFGTGKAGNIAFEFCEEYDIKITCFVDDYKIGEIGETPIVNRHTFKDMYENSIDFVLKGPYQNGAFESTKPVVELPLVLV
jgi:hypothetical protein